MLDQGCRHLSPSHDVQSGSIDFWQTALFTSFLTLSIYHKKRSVQGQRHNNREFINNQTGYSRFIERTFLSCANNHCTPSTPPPSCEAIYQALEQPSSHLLSPAYHTLMQPSPHLLSPAPSPYAAFLTPPIPGKSLLLAAIPPGGLVA